MKAITNKILFIALLFIITACGNKYKIVTRIFLDGSCERVLIVESDSDSLEYEEFPISVDSSWIATIDSTDTTSEKKFRHVFTKKFKNVDELNEEYKRTDNAFSVVNRKVGLKKQFRWFYTFLNYEEVYEGLFKHYPLSDFLVDDEIEIMHTDEADTLPYFIGKDSVTVKAEIEKIEEKYWEWITKNMYEEYFQWLYNKIKEGKFGHIQSDTLIMLKDSVYSRLKLVDNDDLSIDDILEHYDTILNAEGNIINELSAFEEDSTLILIGEKLEFWQDYFWTGAMNDIILPGKLMNTSAEIVRNDTAQFDLHWENYFAEDYVMTVKTKIINKWSFFVSGAIILLALLAYIRAFVKRKKN